MYGSKFIGLLVLEPNGSDSKRMTLTLGFELTCREDLAPQESPPKARNKMLKVRPLGKNCPTTDIPRVQESVERGLWVSTSEAIVNMVWARDFFFELLGPSGKGSKPCAIHADSPIWDLMYLT